VHDQPHCVAQRERLDQRDPINDEDAEDRHPRREEHGIQEAEHARATLEIGRNDASDLITGER
jgi:hypothetical protein